MSKFWILIGVAILAFAFAGKAQIGSKNEIGFDSVFITNLPYFPPKWIEMEDEIDLLKGENDLKMVHKICENYCLQYRRYKQYRKCMLIFNK